MQRRALLPDRVDAGAHQRRNAEIEAELGRALARQAEHHAADDRRARAAGAGDQRQALHQPDLERVDARHLVDRPHALGPGLALAALDEQDRQAADDEGQRHRHRREQVRLDRLRERQPEHHRGHERDQHVEREALRDPVAADVGDGAREALPVLPDDGEHRAGLDRDLEHLGRLAGEAQQRAGDDQVPGRRDRQELGQALDDAHHGGLDQHQRVQTQLPGKAVDHSGRSKPDRRARRGRAGAPDSAPRI